MLSVADPEQTTTTTTTTAAPQKTRAFWRPDEPGLVARAQRGDEAAFAVLYERYRSPIRNFLYRMTENAAVADDLTADTFLKAWLHLPETRSGTAFGGWVYRIAANVFRDRHRHERLLQWQDWAAYAASYHPTQVAPDRPDREALDAETRREVREVLDAVSREPAKQNARSAPGPLYRAILVLSYYHGLSYTEIAERLVLSRAAVKSLLYRARLAFGEAWEARHPEQGMRW